MLASPSYAYILPSHVRRQLADLTVGNLQAVGNELLKVAELYGPEGYISILRGLLDSCDLKTTSNQTDPCKLRLLHIVLETVLQLPNCSTVVCQALVYAAVHHHGLLIDLSRSLGLSFQQQLQLGLAVAEASDSTWRKEGLDFIVTKLSEWPRSSVSIEHGLLHRLLAFLKSQNGALDPYRALLDEVIASIRAQSNGMPVELLPLMTDNVLQLDAARTTHSLFTDNTSNGHGMPDGLSSSSQLAALMQELGHASTSSEGMFRDLLGQVPVVNEFAVAEVLGMMCQNHAGSQEPLGLHSTLSAVLDSATHASDSPSGWDIQTVVSVLRSAHPTLQWGAIMECLDYPGFFVPDSKSFFLLMSAYKQGTNEPFPLHTVVGKMWRNTAGQLSFLRQAVVSPPEVFTFEHSKRKQAPVEGLHAGKSAVGTPNHAWLCLDLIETLCHIGAAGLIQGVMQVLDYPLKHCPEVLLVGTAAVQTQWGVVEREIYSNLVHMYLPSHPNSNVVLHRLWAVNQQLVVDQLVLWYQADDKHISRILDICQELKAIPRVLEITQYAFAIELASLASRREYLNLDKWLQDRIPGEGFDFVREILNFLEHKFTMIGDAATAAQLTPGKVNLNADTVTLFLRALQANAAHFPPALVLELHQVKTRACALYPSVQGALSPALDGFAVDTEAAANTIFQRLYDGVASVDETLAALKTLKSSPEQHDQEVFACMIHSFLDEYRFYPQYPEPQLQWTGELFGQLVHRGLIASMVLAITLQKVLFALATPVGDKFFKFGITALRQFRTDLPSWPSYAAKLLRVPHIEQEDPELWAYIKEVANLDPAMASASLADGVMQPSSTLPPEMPFSMGQPAEVSRLTSRFPAAAQPASGPQRTISPASNLLQHGSSPMFSFPSPPLVPLDVASVVVPEDGGTHIASLSQLASAAAAAATANMAAPLGSVGHGAADNAPSARQPSPLEAPAAAPEPPIAPPPAEAASREPISHGEMEEDMAAMLAVASVLDAPRAPVNPVAPRLPFNTALLDELVFEDFRPPPEHISDKIYFHINNLSINNLDVKAKEVKERVIPEFVGWFANYLVVKRISQEQNLHTLYIKLIDCLENKLLFKMILKATYFTVRVILSSDKLRSDANERKILKNMGGFLGQITFKRNKPILAKELDLKQLLIDAWCDGRLVGIMPFVRAVLEPGSESRVFTATNPLIQALMSLIAEIYHDDTMKLAIKFDIEGLVKNFKYSSPTEIEPSRHLRSKEHRRDLSTANPDLAIIKAAPPDGFSVPQVPQAIADAMAMPSARPHAEQQPLQQQHGPPQLLPPQASAQQQGAAAAAAASTPAGPPGVQVRPSAPSVEPRSPVPLGSTDSAAAAAAASPVSPLAPQAGAAPLPPMAVPPFQYDSYLIATLHQSVVINPQLAALAARVDLKRMIGLSMDKALSENMHNCVERSAMIANMTAGEIVLKDFAMEPDEKRVRQSAHLMASTLAGSMAAVLCKDILRTSLVKSLSGMMPQNVFTEPHLSEQAIQLVVQDNLDVCLHVIEQTAATRAIQDIDRVLKPAFDSRAKARAENRPWVYDTNVINLASRFPRELPESLRPKAAHMNPPQARVYEDFNKVRMSPHVVQARQLVPGAAGGMQGVDAADRALAEGVMTEQGVWDKYTMWQTFVDGIVAQDAQGAVIDHKISDITNVSAELADLVGLSPQPDQMAMAVARKMIRRLFEGSTRAHVYAYVAALDVWRNKLVKNLAAEITQLFLTTEDDRKYNPMHGEALLRARLFVLPELDSYLSKVITNRSTAALAFAEQLVRRCIVPPEPAIAANELGATLEVLKNLAMQASRQSSEGAQLLQLIMQAMSASPKAQQQPQMAQGPPPAAQQQQQALAAPSALDAAGDPPGLRKQATQLLEDWAGISTASADDKQSAWVAKNLPPFLKMDDLTDRFFRNLVEVAVLHSLSSEVLPSGGRPGEGVLNFVATDALVRLVVALATSPNYGEPVLARILSSLVLTLKRDADLRADAFNCRPYLRIMSGLVSELCQGDASDPGLMKHLRPLALALHSAQPQSVPGFAFSWLELFSHRSFMPKLLLGPDRQQGWSLFEALLVALLKFMEPYMRHIPHVVESVRVLYKSTLRVLLVLLHDFPEFLCEHHFQLCDVIPPSCIQMRNLILSAFPRNMRLPDPFTPNLKVDQLPEICQPPRLMVDVDKLLPEALRLQIDAYLRSRNPPSFLAELPKRLLLPPELREGSTAYNSKLINALVLYMGLQSKPGVIPKADSPAMDVFHRLAAELDSEGRYLFLNAIANQLRFPNSHTHYFSCTLLYLFLDAKSELLQEQITRVLLERLIVNRPHPWGLLITFIELIKNPRYSFWSHQFVKCAPEIERLFDSVSRSCMAPPPQRPEDDMVAV